MRNRWYRLFWTELGRRMLNHGHVPDIHPGMPPHMAMVLEGEPPPLPLNGELLLGEPMSERAARHIYRYLWKRLAEERFSRPKRLAPWDGITLLLPFYRGELALLPQAFSSRVPVGERTLSLCGRTGAASLSGVDLWVVPATWDGEVPDRMSECRLRACSLDRIGEVIC